VAVDISRMSRPPLKLSRSKNRVTFRIQLTGEAKDIVNGIGDRLGITHIALCSKIIEWFAGQPDTIQAAILGLYPDLIKADVAQLILSKIAKGDGRHQ